MRPANESCFEPLDTYTQSFGAIARAASSRRPRSWIEEEVWKAGYRGGK